MKEVKIISENECIIDDMKCIAIEHSGCSKCDFYKTEYCELTPPCGRRERKDGRTIVWKTDAKKEASLTLPSNSEYIETKISDDNTVSIIYLEKPKKNLPKSWKEFCDICKVKKGECYIDTTSAIIEFEKTYRRATEDSNTLPNRETAEAVLALCQLIQLRECYNGGWKPDWKDDHEEKFIIEFEENGISTDVCHRYPCSPMFFKSAELCYQFLENFRDLIEKLKPLYGINTKENDK